MQTRRITVVATRCHGCGTINVYWNGVLKRSISLAASTSLNKQVITVVDLTTVHTGTVVIKTMSSAQVVFDALGLSRV